MPLSSIAVSSLSCLSRVACSLAFEWIYISRFRGNLGCLHGQADDECRSAPLPVAPGYSGRSEMLQSAAAGARGVRCAVAADPTTSGSSHLLEWGCFWGYPS
jgi:hypothetical protein